MKIQAEEKAKRLQEKEELKRKKEEEKAKEEKKKEEERLAIEAKKKTEQNKFKSFFSRIVFYQNLNIEIDKNRCRIPYLHKVILPPSKLKLKSMRLIKIAGDINDRHRRFCIFLARRGLYNLLAGFKNNQKCQKEANNRRQV